MSSTLFDVPEEMLEFGGNEWYPVGRFEFAIREVYVNDLGSDEEGEPYDGYASTEGKEVSLRLTDFVPLNGEPEPPSTEVGMFLRICLEDDGIDYLEVDPTDKDHKNLAKGKRRLVALARALGEVPSSDFVDALCDGGYNGKLAGAEFQEWKMGDRKGGFPKKFFAASSF